MTRSRIALIALLAGLVVLAFWLQQQDQWQDVLVFYSDPARFKVWSLITTPWVHLSWSHVAMNSAALCLLVLLTMDYWSARDLINGLIIISAISGLIVWGLAWISGSVISFVGLSAVLHGLFICSVLRLADDRRWIAIAAITVICVKVLAEILGWQPSHFVGDKVGWLHGAGLLAGLAYYVIGKRTLRSAFGQQ
ncbi:hypothetical protein CWI84_00035 [Idiomarina tyrosinivorans]|uniref:Peptidase S54 rhomboid domain-containing protein n=1 Tax=Idiomarina tyrosinivorans TaxID=1445662 RepID=A0A432ZTQ4_9GAMM|nr:rhomboid family intramembrane serine protease [Idiomarina tyrosinivorans]RUO81198.1 hypothetical protein CWI84_00035 [Idiomarina tyrosinivorans]